MLPGRRTDNGSIFVIQGTPPAGTPLVGGIAVSPLGAIYINGGAVAWSPIDLFQQNEQGAWYDPSDLSTMFQDSAGTTPVTADGQPVGLIRDKSGRNNHASQATAAARPLYKTDGTYHWLQFDGVDDSLATASFTIASAGVSNFCGLTKETTQYTILYRFGANLFGHNINSFRSNGESQSYVSGTPGNSDSFIPVRTPSNKKTIYSQIIDRTKPTKEQQHVYRADSTTIATGNLLLDNANIGTGTLFISEPASVMYIGNVYALIILGRTATTQEITDTETWVAAKTGVTLP